MNCRDFIDFLMEYHAGDLPADQRTIFEEHLAECPECVGYLCMYRETVKLGKGACLCKDDAIPDDVPEHLIQAILAARPRPPE